MLEIGFTILTISSIWMITKIWIIRMTTLWEKLFASIMTSATPKIPEHHYLLNSTALALSNLAQTIKIQYAIRSTLTIIEVNFLNTELPI